jgi:hypothetical protein
MNEDFFFLNLFENNLSPRFIDRLTAAILDPPVLDVFPAVSFALHAPLVLATRHARSVSRSKVPGGVQKDVSIQVCKVGSCRVQGLGFRV